MSLVLSLNPKVGSCGRQLSILCMWMIANRSPELRKICGRTSVLSLLKLHGLPWRSACIKGRILWIIESHRYFINRTLFDNPTLSINILRHLCSSIFWIEYLAPKFFPFFLCVILLLDFCWTVDSTGYVLCMAGCTLPHPFSFRFTFVVRLVLGFLFE